MCNALEERENVIRKKKKESKNEKDRDSWTDIFKRTPTPSHQKKCKNACEHQRWVWRGKEPQKEMLEEHAFMNKWVSDS